jgi:uncharacterized cupin superfamily protein
VPTEAKLAQTESGLVPEGDGWFVVNARETRWRHAPGRSALCIFEGDAGFPQVGVNVGVLEPGQIMAMYHWEANQEDFLVVSGEAVLIVEGEERTLGAWDFVHCPPGTKHAIVGGGNGPCVIVSVGAREVSGPGWGGYTPDETAARHGASVADETNRADEAYAALRRRSFVPYAGWLPE